MTQTLTLTRPDDWHLHVRDGVVKLPTTPGLGIDIDWDFVATHPYHGEHGIGAGARPAFGLAYETLPDRLVETLQ